MAKPMRVEEAPFDLGRAVAEWKGALAAAGQLPDDRLEELASHLEDTMAELVRLGLDEEEAFLVAVKRVGNVDAVARQLALAEGDESWRRINLPGTGAGARRRDLALAAVLALAAGLLAKVPTLFGLHFGTDEGFLVWFRNASLFCLPSMAWTLVLVRKEGRREALALSGLVLALALAVNLFPWAADSQTVLLTSIHLPILLWLCVLPLYARGRWRRAEGGMDFVRLTGEAFIYGVLLLLGVAVLIAMVAAVFETAGVKTEALVGDWIVPLCVFAAPVVAVRLAMAKRNVVETIAPALARIFAPLFLLALAGFGLFAAATGRDPFVDRNALIVFDLVLAVVLALVLWSMAMRDPRGKRCAADFVDLALALTALALDLFLLAAMAGRVGTWGLTPNRVAALGENLVLLADLAGTAFLLGRHLLGKGSYRAVLRWQTAFLALIAAWAGIVALVFPLVFGGR